MPQIVTCLPSAVDQRAAETRREAKSVMRHLARAALRLAAVMGVAATPVGATAHAIIVRTSPAQGGVGAADIGKVEVWYDAGIRDAFAALAVVSASGERVDKRDAAIDSADPAHVSVSVNQLTPGKYTVRYRALSADGHLVSGAWEFEVR
jgi:methionine-rich copper-binding protein CopC